MGASKGNREIFLDLPGFGDTIRLTEMKTLLVPIAATRVPILEFTGKYPIIRHLLGYVCCLFHYFFLFYCSYKSYIIFVIHCLNAKILNMRQVFQSIPKYGLLLEYDMNGKLLKSCKYFDLFFNILVVFFVYNNKIIIYAV